MFLYYVVWPQILLVAVCFLWSSFDKLTRLSFRQSPVFNTFVLNTYGGNMVYSPRRQKTIRISGVEPSSNYAGRQVVPQFYSMLDPKLRINPKL